MTVLRAFDHTHSEHPHCYEVLFILELKQKHCCEPLGKSNLPKISLSFEGALGVTTHLPFSGCGWQSSLLSFRYLRRGCFLSSSCHAPTSWSLWKFSPVVPSPMSSGGPFLLQPALCLPRNSVIKQRLSGSVGRASLISLDLNLRSG